jgi:hypothetical protein
LNLNLKLLKHFKTFQNNSNSNFWLNILLKIKKVVHKLPGFKLQLEIYCGSVFFW